MKWLVGIYNYEKIYKSYSFASLNKDHNLFLVYDDVTGKKETLEIDKIDWSNPPFGISKNKCYSIDIDTIRMLSHIKDINFYDPDEYSCVFRSKYNQFEFLNFKHYSENTYKTYKTESGVVYIVTLQDLFKLCDFGTHFNYDNLIVCKSLTLYEIFNEYLGMVSNLGETTLYIQLGKSIIRGKEFLCEIEFEPSFKSFWAKQKVLKG